MEKKNRKGRSRKGAAGRRTRAPGAADARSPVGQPGEPVKPSTKSGRCSAGDALQAVTPAGTSGGVPSDQAATAEMRAVYPGWVWGMEVTSAPYDPDRTEAGPSTFGPDRTGLANASASRTGVRDAEIAPAETETVSVATAARLLGVSRRKVLYLLEVGRLKGWRLRPRGWWKVYRQSLPQLAN